MAPTPLLELRGITRRFKAGDTEVRALDEVSLAIWPGEFVAIMGQSGSGKSTLMNVIGCLDRADAGDYHILGRPVDGLPPDSLASLRRQTFGFVFQRYNLLPGASAAENVEMPALYAGLTATVRAERAKSLLTRLGMAERSGHRPSQLSGGQQQRVAIARA
ncbi:MAG: ABC transporter ATP-binding protein, partial [Candidatus Macondimonas sp.]